MEGFENRGLLAQRGVVLWVHAPDAASIKNHRNAMGFCVINGKERKSSVHSLK